MAATCIFAVDKNHFISKLICRIAEFFGYWPYDIDVSIEWQSSIQSTAHRLLWPMFSLLVYTICIYGQCSTTYLHLSMGFSLLELTIGTFTNVGFSLVSIVSIICGIWNRNTFLVFLRIVRSVDHEVCI